MTIDIEAARAILRANDRGGYTVPTDRLYPFQWNWDSAFVAMGWATFDEERAWRELERLVEGQWDDGMVPHIVFHAPSDDYFPGPDVWRTRHSVPTSGITQPPVFATALRHVFESARGPDAQARAARLYRCALASHDWWDRARDPEGTGLVAILHPWESGMDNSPAWDEAMARLTLQPMTPIRRRDISHIGAEMRPRDEDYHRFIALVDLYAGLGWEPAAMWAASPFKLVDVATNAILHKAEEDLLVLAGQFGSDAERSRIAERMARRAAAFAGLWNQDRRIYQALDLGTGTKVDASTSAGLLPLFAGIPDAHQAAELAAELENWLARAPYPVPSTSPLDPRFEPKRYWRGPVWAVVNFMIAEGFARYEHMALATRIRTATLALMRNGGIAEYFDPTSGEGLGGGQFSWTAAIGLLMTDQSARAQHGL
ncbi:MGH1-like glycoside hydrolase domain-containing protein [Bosea sp. LjRoot237]|uniref:MGH1-like glycoside hydrolase domain-containing protein n=1 Tax=Bosea sp. LjRoot237 TaxID=3342292 RepID=UPI003ECD1BE5